MKLLYRSVLTKVLFFNKEQNYLWFFFFLKITISANHITREFPETSRPFLSQTYCVRVPTLETYPAICEHSILL